MSLSNLSFVDFTETEENAEILTREFCATVKNASLGTVEELAKHKSQKYKDVALHHLAASIDGFECMKKISILLRHGASPTSKVSRYSKRYVSNEKTICDVLWESYMYHRTRYFYQATTQKIFKAFRRLLLYGAPLPTFFLAPYITDTPCPEKILFEQLAQKAALMRKWKIVVDFSHKNKKRMF